MKILDELALESLAERLSRASRRYVLDVRLENYSCKMVSEEKRQYKDLIARLESNEEQESFLQLGPSRTIRGLRELTGQPISRGSYQMSSSQTEDDDLPPIRKRNRSRASSSSEDGNLSSPTKPSLIQSITAKYLFCLMSTLNLSFDSTYDFTTAESEEFCLEPELRVVKHYISRFCSIYVDKYEVLSPKLWTAIDEAIMPQKCSIYSYRPDHTSDPYSQGCMASFNYFFYNKDLKRILFFSLRVLNEPPAGGAFNDEMQDLY